MWTLNYPFPDRPQELYPRILVISRNGRVIQRITAQHYIWKWIFWDGGRQIAYKDGSPRFTMRCVLVHSKTTLELENYDCFSELPKNAPLWLESLEKVHQSAFSPQLRYTADRSLPVYRLLFNY